MSDFIYKNSNDSKRVKIFTTGSGTWDIDFWDKDSKSVWTFGAECGENFKTRKEAKVEAQFAIGKLTSINPETVTEGW